MMKLYKIFKLFELYFTCKLLNKLYISHKLYNITSDKKFDLHFKF